MCSPSPRKRLTAFNHNYIGTEHILLGLVREGDGVAAKVLSNLGVELNKVRSAVEFIIGRGDRTVLGEIGLTPRAKKVIELAVDEARRLGHSYIGTEHLLLGLVREGEGIAAGVLESLGVNLSSASAPRPRASSASLPPRPAGTAAGGTRQASRTPTVDQLGIELTAAAGSGQLDPVIGRSTELERVVQILSRRTKNNPVLIGEPGVGKTADRRAARPAHQSAATSPRPSPKSACSPSTSAPSSPAPSTAASSRSVSRRSSRRSRGAGNCILFIDELHMLVGAGAAEGAVDAANILKPALARGELQCIGATTLDEYRKHIERDAALERRFQPIVVDEPTVEETVEILRGIRGRYEEHHNLKISDDALSLCRRPHVRPLRDRALPARQGHRPHRRGLQPRAHPPRRHPALHAGGAQGAREPPPRA